MVQKARSQLLHSSHTQEPPDCVATHRSLLTVYAGCVAAMCRGGAGHITIHLLRGGARQRGQREGRFSWADLCVRDVGWQPPRDRVAERARAGAHTARRVSILPSCVALISRRQRCQRQLHVHRAAAGSRPAEAASRWHSRCERRGTRAARDDAS
eukprot:2836254-Prymnesium_polylepis.1